MSNYVCPMHPEVQQKKPGKCPRCGMQLVQKDQSHYARTIWKNYLPFMVIIAILLLVSFTIGIRDYELGVFALENVLMYFMAGFFLVFSGFKLMDLKGFANSYATYDLFAQKWFGYGYLYPFIELFFGLAMILHFQTQVVLWTELFVMLFSGVGVALKLAKHEQFQCACLGTFLKVPLTKVTLLENFGMAALAIVLLLWR